MSRSRKQASQHKSGKQRTAAPADGAPGPETRGTKAAATPASASVPITSRTTVVALAAGLAVLSLAVFAGLRHADFIRLDDPGYVATNAHVNGGFTAAALRWAWTTGHAANWHPLTWMSHMLDAQLFGLWAGGHHATSVALHAINTVLLFALLFRTTGAAGRSAFVAALFAVHPMHVESVAWVAERKDVLSTLFWLLATIAYVSWTRARHRGRYVLACVFMALGLMAKPMLVTLPFALLLFDLWPLRRWTGTMRGLGRLLIEKLPFLALAITSSLITFAVQRQGGAMTGLDLLPFTTRVANALVAYARYLGKLFWPADMVIFYPYREALPWFWVAGSAILLLSISVVAVRARQRRPYFTSGWFWFVGTLVPVIGLIQVGTQAIADRYTYVPYIGAFIVLAWGGVELATAVRIRREVTGAIAAALVAICAFLAYGQTSVWLTNASVWRHAASASPNNYLAENEVGMVLVGEEKHDEARAHFEASSRLKPEFAEARNNLGLSYMRSGRIEDALNHYRLAVRLKPGFPEAEHNLAYALMARGQIDEAAVHYQAALRARPDFALAHTDYGVLLATQGNVTDAIAHLQQAVRLEPANTRARFLLAVAYGAAFRYDEAAEAFREVLKAEPSNAAARDGLARIDALKRAGGKRK